MSTAASSSRYPDMPTTAVDGGRPSFASFRRCDGLEREGSTRRNTGTGRTPPGVEPPMARATDRTVITHAAAA